MELKLPEGLEAFLAGAGWGGAVIEPLAGDASFRRYFRIRLGERSAMLMDAPPPNEDPAPFLRAAKWLDGNGLRAPRVLAEDAARGLVLLEDFGEVRMREYLDQWPADEAEVYQAAIDALVELHRLPPGPFLDYSLAEYQRVAASALAGMAAAKGPAISVAQASALALAVLGASGAAGAFNHYYERDLDREMRRTRSRPFASGAFQPSLWWPISFLALLVASLALAAAANGLVSSLLVFLGSFTYGVVYTVWLKRRSAWNIVIGGLAGSFAVLAGAAAAPSGWRFAGFEENGALKAVAERQQPLDVRRFRRRPSRLADLVVRLQGEPGRPAGDREEAAGARAPRRRARRGRRTGRGD